MLGHGGVAPVPGTAHVGGDALTLMEDLDGAVRDPDPELLFGQGVGHRVIMLAQFVNRMRHLVTAAARQARSLAPGARPTRWNQLR